VRRTPRLRRLSDLLARSHDLTRALGNLQHALKRLDRGQAVDPEPDRHSDGDGDEAD
jgi:hypothetical protein